MRRVLAGAALMLPALVAMIFVAGVTARAAGIGPSAVPVAASNTGPVALASHEADYTMGLQSVRLSGGVVGVSGVMSYRFADSCDGWTVENKTALNFSYSDGNPVATTWDFVTWESKDGQRYRFRVHSTRNGAVDQDITGTARLDGRGKGGTAIYTQPENKTIRLPEGTIFPTEHTIRLLEAASGGKHFVARVVFDGTDDSGAFDVDAVVGRGQAANSNISPAISKPSVNAVLLSGPSWPFHIAFFSQGSKDALPDYEVGLRYYLNGVADEMVQSFGTFSLKGTLEKLQPLAAPSC